MTLDNLGTEKFSWDLGIFYSDLIDPRLDADIATLAEMIKTFNLNHKGKLRETESRAERWLELTEKTFNFATYARQAFIAAKGQVGLELKKEMPKLKH